MMRAAAVTMVAARDVVKRGWRPIWMDWFGIAPCRPLWHGVGNGSLKGKSGGGDGDGEDYDGHISRVYPNDHTTALSARLHRPRAFSAGHPALHAPCAPHTAPTAR